MRALLSVGWRIIPRGIPRVSLVFASRAHHARWSGYPRFAGADVGALALAIN
jgi:hypothetical protein